MTAGPTVRFRIDFGPDSSIGPGKVELLEQIERAGSLSRAARNLGMSYRRAWLLLDSLNKSFLEPVAVARVGGYGGGGGVTLTRLGKELIRAYRAFDKELQSRAAKRFSPIKARVPRKARTVRARASIVRLSER
jgi:molybdate transport system regulatory protein